MTRAAKWAIAAACVVAPACASDPTAGRDPSVMFDLDARFADEGAFFDFPYPSDLRLTPQGTPDVAGFPDPGVPILAGLKKGATERRGFPVVPAAYFKFKTKLLPRDPTVVIEG